MAELANFDVLSNTSPTLRFSLVTPEDVTGWTTRFTVKRTANSNTLISLAGSIANNENGVFDVVLYANTTANLSPGSYTYSFRRTDAGSEDVLTTGTMKYKLVP